MKERSGGEVIPLVLRTCADFLEQQGVLIVLNAFKLLYMRVYVPLNLEVYA